jgi:hypothetical protein
METLTLKNGAQEAQPLVSITTILLKNLIREDPIAFYELVMCCRDAEHTPFGNTAEKLQARRLYPVHDSIRNIVLSAVTGEGLAMQLGSPVQD